MLLTDEGVVQVDLGAGDVATHATWGLFYPECQKHPLLALVAPGNIALFELFLDRDGVKDAREILSSLVQHGRFLVSKDGVVSSVSINKSRDLKLVRKMKKLVDSYVPGSVRG